MGVKYQARKAIRPTINNPSITIVIMKLVSEPKALTICAIPGEDDGVDTGTAVGAIDVDGADV